MIKYLINFFAIIMLNFIMYIRSKYNIFVIITNEANLNEYVICNYHLLPIDFGFGSSRIAIER
jgi:hypothetical protein